ncbi:MAG: Y-family DNA polymerase [Treponema sp.]|nr:Y-family DNA polymerase [Treponema sp.]
MIFHIDGNSFYASCERIFRPDLTGQPVAVLTNNDGVVIALNQECKDRGFKRGDLYFEVKNLCEQKGVRVFSSNYTLYADISRRLNLLYSEYGEELELYSIDESFVYLPDWKNGGYTEIGREIRERAMQEIHVPVSVGIAPTKTLAKLCNKLAKKYGGVCSWQELDGETVLASYPAADIWGIGHAKAELLALLGVHTAYDLANFPLDKAKKYLSITGFRTVQELNGIPALDRNELTRKQNIGTSKSFAHGVTDFSELETALAEYAQLAVGRMRAESSACRIISVYLMTARAFRPEDKGKEYFNAASAELPSSTSYLPVILASAKKLLRSLYRYGYEYRKIMINLLALEDDTEIQPELFYNNTGQREKDKAVMSACDCINAKFGRGIIHPGTRNLTKEVKADGKKADWIMERKMLSPEYTTDLNDIPEVY